MTAGTDASSPASLIDLTRTPDFGLGAARVRPSTCEVFGPHEAIRLQPRVMQVLVALAEATGTAVSRDVLRARCWGVQVVGDDSINRCILRLRRLSEVETPGSFTLETIPKLGYRLTAAKGAGQPEDPRPPPKDRRAWRAWAVGVTVLALAGVVALIPRPDPTHWSVSSFERLVSAPIAEGNPAISPDGTLIAYAAGPDYSHRRIYLRRLTSGESIQLTDGPWDETAPAWAPDGARLAYVAEQPGQPCRLMVMPSPKGLAREVARCRNQENSSVDWTSLGDGLFFVDSVGALGSTQIFRFDLVTGARRAITHPSVGQADSHPRLSPDGRRVAFLRDVSRLLPRVWIHDLATGAERAIGGSGRYEVGFAWAEDSKAIFIAGGVGEESAIWSYPIDGRRRNLVTRAPLVLGRLASGRGGLLAAEVKGRRTEVVRPPPAKGGAPVVIDPASGLTSSLAYAADGTLAMVSDRSGQNAIWLKRPGETTRQLMGFGAASIGGLEWSPEGGRLAFLWVAGDTKAIRVISRAGTDLATIPLPGASVGWPAWSGDGRSLVYPASDRQGWRIWRVSLEPSGPPIPVTGYGWWSVATRGEELYGSRMDRPGIWRIADPPRLVTAQFSASSSTGLVIFKDSILLAHAGQKRLFAVPVSGGPARPFVDMPLADSTADFALDPISGNLAYLRSIEDHADIELYRLKRR